MPPIQLSRSERASLSRIAERPCLPGELPADHEEKFLNYGLVRKHVLLLYATPLGQCELLRQRFRGMELPQIPPGEPVPSGGILNLPALREA
jgi:hypothetical protein